MANSYKISFEVQKQFAIVGKTVNFNILDADDNKVADLAADLTALGANGATFDIATNESGEYGYNLTITAIASEAPEGLGELVTVKYQGEDINEQVNTLILSYIPQESVSGYIGDDVTLSWSQGTVTASEVASAEVASANDAVITLLAEGTTTCKLTYNLDGNAESVEGVSISVSSPSTSAPVTSDLTENSVVLTSNCTPNNPTITKFRYGIAEEFNPDDDTTYTETEASLSEGTSTLSISELEPQTSYKAQAVMTYSNNTYVSEAITFITEAKSEGGATTLEVTFDKNDINLITSSSFTQTIKASVTPNNEGSTLAWVASAVEGFEVSLSGEDTAEVTATIKYVGEVEKFTNNVVPSTITLKVTETLDDSIIGAGTGALKVNLYNVINLINLYIDGNVASEAKMTMNSALTYNSVTPDGNDGSIYSYDSETDLVKAVKEGTGAITVNVTLDTDESITDVDVEVAINVLNALTIPTDMSELLKICKVFNYESEMYGFYRRNRFKTLVIDENLGLNAYIFKTNDPKEIKWEFDIAMLSKDYVKAQLVNLSKIKS